MFLRIYFTHQQTLANLFLRLHSRHPFQKLPRSSKWDIEVLFWVRLGKQNALSPASAPTSCSVNSLALLMSALVSLPTPLTSYLRKLVSISRTVVSFCLATWNLLGRAARTFSWNRIVAYSEHSSILLAGQQQPPQSSQTE